VYAPRPVATAAGPARARCRRLDGARASRTGDHRDATATPLNRPLVRLQLDCNPPCGPRSA